MAANVKLEELVLLEDEPVSEDSLGLDAFARVIAGTAVGTKGPFTIGVYAGWGHGKTSVLKQASGLLEAAGNPNIVAVWFNAWQYERETHPLFPLIACIVRDVEAKIREADRLSAMGRKSAVAIVNALRAIAYGVKVKAEVGVPGLAKTEVELVGKEMIEREERLRALADPPLERSIYYDALSVLNDAARLHAGAKAEARLKVVVFVDDLDRCLPDQGLRLLESIKLVLSQPGFIFALAVDPEIIERYLERRYRTEFNVRDYRRNGTSYLDKIVQLPIRLPPHKNRFRDHIRTLTKHPALSQAGSLFTDLQEVLALGSDHNPRNLARFVNNLLVDRYIIRRQLGQEASVEFMRVCAVSRSLQHHLDYSLYQALANDKDLCEAIANAPGRLISERGEGLPGLNRRDKRRGELLQKLEDHGFVQGLLDDAGSGSVWLRNHTLRAQVDDFLGEQRQRVEPAPEQPQDVIGTAVRRSLRLAAESPITTTELARVSKLHLGRMADDQALQTVAAMTNLRRLVLIGASVTDAGLVHLRGLRRLEELDLEGTLVTDAGMGYLVEMPALHTLWLVRTAVTGAGLAEVARCKALKHLDLEGTSIDDDSLEALSGLPMLEVLDVKDTAVSDEGVMKIARLNKLRDLNLDGAQVTSAGLRYLRELPNLKLLGLANTSLTDNDADVLASLKQLEELDLTDAVLSGDAVRRIKKALPGCKIYVGE